MRWKRASACSSTVGFHWGSMMYELVAAEMYIPTAAHEMVMRMTEMFESQRKFFKAEERFVGVVLPS